MPQNSNVNPVLNQKHVKAYSNTTKASLVNTPTKNMSLKNT